MEIYLKIVTAIIKKQESIIGPLAWMQAKKVSGLVINSAQDSISFEGDPKDIINNLISEYEKILGKVARNVCRDSVSDITSKMDPLEVPSSLWIL